MQLVIVALVLVVAIVLHVSWSNSHAQKVKRGLVGTAPGTVAAAPEGALVRITGRVVAQGTVEAPLSGRPCVCYELIIEETTISIDQDPLTQHTTELVREVGGASFFVEDATGRVLVDLDRAQLTLRKDHETRSGFLDDASERERAVLARHRLEPTRLVFNRKLAYREGVIVEGERVAAAGWLVRDPDAVRLIAGPEQPVLLTDAVA